MKYSKKAIAQTSEALVEYAMEFIQVERKIRSAKRELLMLEENRNSILSQMGSNVSILEGE